MGANEKYEAAMHGYVPDIGQIRDAWVDSKIYHLPKSTRTALVPTVQAEFDRWLETVRSEAKAEALREAAISVMDERIESETEASNWLDTRANKYKEAPNA